jgi:hypothetical protein
MEDISNIVSNNLNEFKQFTENYDFPTKYVKCLFLNAYNHFLAAKILAESGLICQSNNCLRMGLESEWLGIYYLKNLELSIDWAHGTGDTHSKKMIKKLERPSDLRKEISKISCKRINENDRNEIYQALSDKSHTKLASIAIVTVPPNSTDQSEYKVECIPAGGLKGEIRIAIILRAVNVVQEFALAEIEDSLGYKLLPDNWTYVRTKLSKISQGGSHNEKGEFEPFVSSKNHPGSDGICYAAFLEAIRTQSLK